MKDCIQDFIQSWRKYDKSDTDTKFPCWDTRFRSAGYYPVLISNITQWTQIHAWCTETVGHDHYAWSGNTFYFESDQAAIQFTLRWS